MKKLFFSIFSLMFAFIANAQSKPDMADVMRSNGKIYVVLSVCLLILTGLFFYIFLLDRKIKKIEQNKM